MIKILKKLWKDLYNEKVSMEKLEELMCFLERAKTQYKPFFKGSKKDWYKDAVIYSLYADLFNRDLRGLIGKLDYLQDLGVTCIWLLPILESPMKDAGFDISDYTKIRADLTNGDDNIFEEFLLEAHKRDIRVIFDIALNHCSVEHPWFRDAISSQDSMKRGYFIWSDDKDKYKEARIIFKGLCESNWQWEPNTKQYFFHRFFEIQPDLNYRNPDVLIEMTKTLVNWKLKGLDGFRADAIPYIWKEEGTDCENLPGTHNVVKFFRVALDYIEEGTLLLAEACQPPKKVVEYFGEGDECNAAYHFPVMPRIYRSMAEGSGDAIKMALSPDFTPQDIPQESQWLMFLRCHDELTLEMVTAKERKFLFDYYCKESLWSFREGEGISARLASLLEENPVRIKLAFSIMFSLLGTPIIFYGDEFGKTNDLEFYEEQVKLTGIKDSRYLVRGRIDWDKVENELKNENSLAREIYDFIKEMIKVKRENPAMGRGTLRFIDLKDKDENPLGGVLAYDRVLDETITILQNLKDETIWVNWDTRNRKKLIGNEIHTEGDLLMLEPYGFYWFGGK